MWGKKKPPKIPPCNTCPKKRVVLMKSNYEVFSIFEEWNSLMIDQEGIHINIINEIVNTYEFSKEKRLDTVKSLMLCCKTLINVRSNNG